MCVRVKFKVFSFSKDFMELFFSQLVLSQSMFSFPSFYLINHVFIKGNINHMDLL